MSEGWTTEDRERVLVFLGGMERTRLNREAAGRDEEICPEWEKSTWPEILANLMTAIAQGWVGLFKVYVEEGDDPGCPQLYYKLTARGSRAVDAHNRRILRP